MQNNALIFQYSYDNMIMTLLILTQANTLMGLIRIVIYMSKEIILDLMMTLKVNPTGRMNAYAVCSLHQTAVIKCSQRQKLYK